ncbi:MAG: DNRLRE domain-containing protein [Verrucomicrobiota bacterium]
MNRFGCSAIALLISSSCFSQAEVTEPPLLSVADTTLIEAEPDHNLGGVPFFNAGTAGPGGKRNRGLFRFEVSSIPGGAKIKSAILKLEVTQEPQAGPIPSFFSLHRLLRSWGEGEKIPTSSPGLGLPATQNEATWNDRFALTTNAWRSPGAANDFAAVVSYSQYIYGVDSSPYFFPHYPETAPQLTGDVQFWLDHPGENFGWLLKTESESVQGTARRFGSRESDFAPELIVEFIRPPKIVNWKIVSNQFQFSFFADVDQSYAIQFCPALSNSNNWLTLTNIAPLTETNMVVVRDSLSATQRFYRIALP